MSAKPEQYDLYDKTLDILFKNPQSATDNILQQVDATGDYLESSYDVDDSFDPLKFISERDSEIQKLSTSSQDETIYGYQPPSWMPDWVKAGYQNSITGLTERVKNGQPIKNYDLNLLEDVGATLISFLQPLDLATMVAGGGIGGFGARTALKEGAKQAIKQGLKKTSTKKLIANKIDDKVAMQVLGGAPDQAIKAMVKAEIPEVTARRAVQNAAPRVVHKALIQGAGGGVGLGFYSGLSTALATKIEQGDVDEVVALKEGLKGAVLGAVTSGTQPVSRAFFNKLKPATTKAQKIVQETAVKAIETAEFGTIAPVLSGEDINVEGYVHAAATIGGLTAQRYAFGAAKKGYNAMRTKKYDSIMDAETAARYAMDTAPDNKKKTLRNIIELEEVFVNKNGTRYDRLKFDDKNKRVTLRNKESQKEETVSYDSFNRVMFRRESSAQTPEGLARGRNTKISKLQKQLGFSDEKIKEYANSVKIEGTTDKFDPNQTLGDFMKPLRLKKGSKLDPDQTVGDFMKPLRLKVDPKDPKGLKGLTAVEQVKLLNELRHEKRVSDLKDSFTKSGWEGDLLPRKRLLDEILPTLPKAWRQTKNRVSTQFGELAIRELNKADALELTTLGTFIQELNATGLLKGGLFRKKKQSKRAEEIADALEDPRYNPNNTKLGRQLPHFDEVIKIKKVLKNIWDRAEEAGVDLGRYEENYFPRMIKPEFLAKFSNDIAKIGSENPSLLFDKNSSNRKSFQDIVSSYVKNNKLDPSTILVLEKVGGVTKKDKQNINSREYAQKVSQALYELNERVTIEYHNVAKNAEISRTAEKIPKAFLERDARLVLARYTKQLSRRISFVEMFGSKGEKFYSRIGGLRKASKEQLKQGNQKLSKKLAEEARLLDQLFKSYTNKIEIDPTYNWKTPTARKFWSDVVNLEIGTKIGLGFAVVPNITQLFISTAVKTGYMPIIKGTLKMAMPTKEGKKYRDEIRKSGVSNLSVFQLIAGLEPSEGWASTFANVTTKATGFQFANKINQLVSAAAAKEWISALQKTANNKSSLVDIGIPSIFGGRRINRRQWAIDNLKALGIENSKVNFNSKKGKQLELEAMYRFSRDSQLQRNVINEASAMLDPRWRPFFLFKKFGYKQFNWMREQLTMELKRGNIFPMLRLAAAGMAGGEMVTWARDFLAEYISGNKVYDDNRFLLFKDLPEAVPMTSQGMSQDVDMRNFTTNDFVDRFASVGAFGVIGDIVANENRIRALEFAFKPAVVQDFDKIWSAFTRTLNDSKDYGIGAALRAPKYIAPLLGTIPRRGLERFERKLAPGQRESYVKRIKQIRLPEIKQAIIDGDSDKAFRIIQNYNNAFGNENPILPEDWSPTKITDYMINKIKKKQRP